MVDNSKPDAEQFGVSDPEPESQFYNFRICNTHAFDLRYTYSYNNAVENDFANLLAVTVIEPDADCITHEVSQPDRKQHS